MESDPGAYQSGPDRHWAGAKKGRENISRVLKSQGRRQIKTGELTPPSPGLFSGTTRNREKMLSSVGGDSWLVFDLLDLPGSQDYLVTLAFSWHHSTDCMRLQEFATNLTIVNALAERGIHLATYFIRRVESE